MNKKQYNNIIDWTLKHEQAAQTEDSLPTARAIFNNMGVALPNGNIQQVYETIKTNDYMGWKSCTMQKAQEAADRGIASIGISKDKIVVLSATDDEEPVKQTVSVMALSGNTSAGTVSNLEYYSYSHGTTTQDDLGTQNSLYFAESNLSVERGWTGYNKIYGSILSTVCWVSSDTTVASVDYYSGYITAKKSGMATITARSCSEPDIYEEFEIWVKGITPVFLVHGRTSNSEGSWGIKTNIPEWGNNHFDSSISADALNGKKYTAVDTQKITGFLEDPGGSEKPYQLGNKLKDAGYKENINLFVFNYPNEDAVVHSSKKFEVYIGNLISYVRSYGTDEMKACFYRSRADYTVNNYKINLVGHSMGGLVCRYYIENLGRDARVDKLITICTPHWGSGYANVSNITGISHVLCDHDLDLNSAMYGGSNIEKINNGCSYSNYCTDETYTLTDELQYLKSRHTKYYAIAGVDYDANYLHDNDYTFDMPTNFTTYQQIVDYMTTKGVYKLTGKDLQTVYEINIKNVGDNMVGFLSQIGWTGDNPGANSTIKKVSMEKIFVDVDTNGGNGGELFIWEVVWNEGKNILHSKVNHREPVCDKVIEYLKD